MAATPALLSVPPEAPGRPVKRPGLGEVLQQLLFLTSSFSISLSHPNSDNFLSRNPACWKLHPLISQMAQAAPFLSLPPHLSSLLSCRCFLPCLVQAGQPHGETEEMLFRKDVSSWQPAYSRDLAALRMSSNCSNPSRMPAITITTAYVSLSQLVFQRINLKGFSLADCT